MVARSDFHEGNKYHPHVFLKVCLFKLVANNANKFVEWYVNVAVW